MPSLATKDRRRRYYSRSVFRDSIFFRPAYNYPVEPRKEPNFNYRLIRAIYPVFRVLLPNQMIRADDLARAMVDVVLRQAQERQGVALRTEITEAWSSRELPSRIALSNRMAVREGTRAIFGRTYADEPDVLIEQLRKDEAIAEADSLLLTIPNQLGVLLQRPCP